MFKFSMSQPAKNPIFTLSIYKVGILSRRKQFLGRRKDINFLSWATKFAVRRVKIEPLNYGVNITSYACAHH